ncbi:MAG: tRNA (adenosine(37)-N6)-threonylcarbamoyltransferase complex ATPase subunit type 1 TsaE [Armatimonadetes bacterium]|nr:tRNA (adenosine(37)-N6)-threonylcarbamoyltransferase complex ATPase subunit type 1 TsaE [Armatimonadota bacterium]
MIELGRRLAARAKPGLIIRLIGPLGVGKTTLARGFIRGLGFEGDVRSPTFNLIFEYSTQPPVCHADLFRLSGPREIADLGLEEYFETHAVLIEWAEKAGDLLPEDAATIELSFADVGREARLEGLET